jgi:hypothetical protein
VFSDLGGEKPRLDEIHGHISSLGDNQLRPIFGDAAVLINISQIIESVSRKVEKH